MKGLFLITKAAGLVFGCTFAGIVLTLGLPVLGTICIVSGIVFLCSLTAYVEVMAERFYR